MALDHVGNLRGGAGIGLVRLVRHLVHGFRGRLLAALDGAGQRVRGAACRVGGHVAHALHGILRLLRHLRGEIGGLVLQRRHHAAAVAAG